MTLEQARQILEKMPVGDVRSFGPMGEPARIRVVRIQAGTWKVTRRDGEVVHRYTLSATVEELIGTIFPPKQEMT